jgi:TRAP-type C4-dicarboxylate transport system permease large subunit
VLWQSLVETVRTSCMVLIIVAGALVFGRFLAVTNLPTFLATGLAELPVPSWVTMAIILFFYMTAGCFVDALALVLLTIPIFYPIVISLGYDPVWFGIMVVMLVQMGVITPPVGVNVYVVSGIERTIPMQNIFRHALPFAGLLVIASIIMMIFPDLALILPRALGR